MIFHFHCENMNPSILGVHNIFILHMISELLKENL